MARKCEVTTRTSSAKFNDVHDELLITIADCRVELLMKEVDGPTFYGRNNGVKIH